MRRIPGFIELALNRLRNQAALVACVLLGVTMAVAFASALPTFVNSAQLRVLRQLLLVTTGRDSTTASGVTNSRGDPLFMRFAYVSAMGGRLSIPQLHDLDEFMRTRIEARTILPVAQAGMRMRTDRWALWPAANTQTGEVYVRQSVPLLFASMEVYDGIEDHIALEEGVMPAAMPKDGSVPVLVHRHFSDKYGVRPGDVFSLTMNVSVPLTNTNSAARNTVRQVQTMATVAGVWTPVDPDEDFWFISPFGMSDGLLVTRDTFETQVAEFLPDPVDYVVYNYNLNDAPLQTEMVEPLLARTETLRNDAFQKRQGISLSTNLTNVLTAYVKASREMTLLMVAFAAPLLVIVLYFIVLVSGMVIRRQEMELITLRSRGASSGDTLGLYAIQSVIIGIFALILGMPLGYLIGTFMTGARTFLDFSGPVRLASTDFINTFNPQYLPFRFAIGAVIIATLATMLPALSTSRSTVVLLSADRGRNTRSPFWQRFYLDVLLLVPVAYGYMQLSQQGNIGLFGRTISNENPLRDPVRYLLPMLLMTSLALIVARIFPLLMRLIAAVLQRMGSKMPFATPSLLAARELGRAPKDYLGSLLLLIVATGIATFGASTAKTLDGHLIDSVYFVTGADLRLVEDAQSNKPKPVDTPGGQPQAPPPDDGKPEIWSFLPVEDHMTIPGVEAFARITTLQVRPQIARQIGDFSLRVLDWHEASSVMQDAFRADYASKSFGALMNDLGAQPDGVLVPPIFLNLNRKAVGDPLRLDIQTTEGRVPVTYTIAGTYKHFPTVQPGEDETVFIADMEYTFEKLGKAVPYEVMLTLAPDASGTAVSNRADQMGYMVEDTYDARLEIQKQQQTPERQGLFGILTAGFFAAIALTIISFVLYSILSFRRRAIELGVLRTLGLSSWQVAAYLILAQLGIVLTGTIAGAGVGVLASRLFIPFFQVAGRLVSEVPAFYIRIAWTEVAQVSLAIAFAFAIAIAATLLLLRRMKAFEAIKLGGVM
jgi:putative ABC transport system permease protein